ncbi:MAG TPA: hypothetical protein VGL26_05815 [Jatrophihabitans sp.]|jgi:hypothetical protein
MTFRNRSFTAALALILGASAAAFTDVALSIDSVAQAAPVHSVVAGPATSTPGGYVAVTPFKVADTRTGAGRNRKGALPAKKAASFQITARGGVPRSGVGAVSVRVVVVSPKKSGSLTLYRSLTPAPIAYSVQFDAGQQTYGATVVRLSSTGRLAIMNHSTAAVQIALYVDGYFTKTSAAAAASTPGAFVPVTPKRVVDTRTGAGGNKRGRVNAKSQFTAQIGGKASVPASAAAIVGVLSVMSPAKSGGAVAWQSATTRPSTPSVQFAAAKNAGAMVVIPLASNGRIGLRNDSAGKVSLVLDVVGYYVPGASTQQASASFVVATTVLNKGIKANRKVTVRVSSAGRIPVSNVAAVAAVVGVTSPGGAGTVLAYPDGKPKAAVTASQFGKGSGVSTALLLPVSSTGRITLQNKSHATSHLTLTVVGYVLKNTVLDPVYSKSHYIRRAMTYTNDDLIWMQNLGMADVASGSNLIVLHIGVQLSDKSGAWLSAMPDDPKYKIPYAWLVDLVKAYLVGFGPHPNAVVAVATNNSNANWTGYTAAQRGADWWGQVIAPLQGLGTPVYGADDIESAWGSTVEKYSDALDWESAYLAGGGRLVYTGSANGCPYKSIGQPGGCNNGWTKLEYYRLAGGNDPSHVFALPQIYNNNLAIQWPNIDLAGGGQINFLGALTEAAACSSPGQSCGSFSPQAGLAALTLQLIAAAIPVPDGLRATDLDIQK